MNITSTPGFLEKALDRLADEALQTKPLLPLYLHLIVSSIFPIFIAAHASLRRPNSAAPAKKKKSRKVNSQDSETEEESSSPIETLTTSDAIMFPILAGGTLTALYVTIKWLEDPSILNKILGYYFNWIGTFFTFKLIKDSLYLARSAAFPTQFSHRGTVYKHNAATNIFEATGRDGRNSMDMNTTGLFGRPFKALPSLAKARKRLFYTATCSIMIRKPFSPSKVSFSITSIDILAAVISALLGLASTFLGKTPWYLTNLQGFSFCYGSLQFMSPGTSATGSLLLSLLFFYDIYMVFYTPMMVTVATKLEVPIKLLFPRPDDGTCPKPIGALPGSEEMEEYVKCLAKKRTMAMLGLGDIVVPGIMIAFALRFDLYRFYLKMKTSQAENGAVKKRTEDDNRKEIARPTYMPVRGMWAERFYTARHLWSPALKAKSFPKPYFKATMVGYVFGMVATLLVMQVWQHAQPALLYLVPGVLISFWGMASWRGEVKLLWDFDEAKEDKEKQKEGGEKNEKQEATSKDSESATDDSAEQKKSAKTVDDAESNEERVKPDRPVFSFNIYLPAISMPADKSEPTSPRKSHDDRTVLTDKTPREDASANMSQASEGFET